MSKIRLLSEHMANQIAAGEVVERPASVVKELLENSLDSGADRVEVQIERGGTGLIRVVDNGSGMDSDDVLLSLERHATSKLTDESQLSAIATLGFRGEALPSIGSVSRMTILSRAHQQLTGTKADIRYGTLHAVHEDNCSRGTIIEVRNLFGNLPARKKFLKTHRTELAHIDEVIRSQSLAHPEVAFSLQIDNRESFYFSAADLEQRVRDVFRYEQTLLPVEAEDAEAQLKVEGFLLMPDAVVSAKLRILVNGRPVQDRMIRHGVMEGLQGFLMKGHQPAGALLFTLSPELVDVNVHPAKREIRFRNAPQTHRFLVHAVARAIENHQDRLRQDLFGMPEQYSSPGPDNLMSADVSVGEPVQQSLPEENISSDFHIQSKGISSFSNTQENSFKPVISSSPPPEFSKTSKNNDESRDLPGKGLHLIGQFLQLYLLCERDSQLVVIDQHAAHERILYQKLRHSYEQGNIASQSLLFPVTVDLSPAHAEIMEKEGAALTDLGVKVEHFGESTWVIQAMPAMVSHLAPQEVIIDILDGLRNRSSTDMSGVIPECIDNLLASMACKAAIKAGNQLQPEEMLALLRQMESSDVFSHCPHGRPVVKTFSHQEIEKWFHRT